MQENSIKISSTEALRLEVGFKHGSQQASFAMDISSSAHQKHAFLAAVQLMRDAHSWIDVQWTNFANSVDSMLAMDRLHDVQRGRERECASRRVAIARCAWTRARRAPQPGTKSLSPTRQKPWTSPYAPSTLRRRQMGLQRGMFASVLRIASSDERTHVLYGVASGHNEVLSVHSLAVTRRIRMRS